MALEAGRGQELLLGVNIDHVATLRQARRAREPDPLLAALLAEQAGADSITLHLREDRRHIQDHDVERFAASLTTHMNFEMAATAPMLAIAKRIRPSDVCLVPEQRTELTTEGGLDVAGLRASLAPVVEALTAAGVRVSLFIDPDARQLEAAVAVGAPVIELHTGAYADATGLKRRAELKRLAAAARQAAALGLVVNAGHGLDYHNVGPVAALPEIVELNIGYAIIGRALFTGIEAAVRDMKRLMREARSG